MSTVTVDDGWRTETTEASVTPPVAQETSHGSSAEDGIGAGTGGLGTTADVVEGVHGDVSDSGAESAVGDRARDERGRFAKGSDTPDPAVVESEDAAVKPPSKRSPEGRKLTLQQEIDLLVKQRETIRREIESAHQARPQEQPRAVQPTGDRFPTFDDFSTANPGATYDDYTDARADWRAERKFQALQQQITERQQQTEQLSRTKDLQSQGRSVYTDWDDVFSRVGDIPISPALERAIVTDPDGHRLAYELAKDPAAHSNVLDAPDDFALGVALGTLKARLSGASAAPPRQTTATPLPAPIKPLGSSPTQPVSSLDAKPFDRWTADDIRKANEAERKGRRL